MEEIDKTFCSRPLSWILKLFLNTPQSTQPFIYQLQLPKLARIIGFIGNVQLYGLSQNITRLQHNME